MPTSLTPASRPADDEVECGNCGAYIYHDLLKCPNCGVYLDEPNEPEEERPKFRPKCKFVLRTREHTAETESVSAFELCDRKKFFNREG